MKRYFFFAFTANHRGRLGTEMTQEEIEELLRTGNINIADNGSNIHALLQGAFAAFKFDK